VQVLTVFQAKGLEFPVTVWWDASATLKGRDSAVAWRVERDGSAWSLNLKGCTLDDPSDSGMSDREARYREAERLRLIYVAVTRTRDLLILPLEGNPNGRFITGELLQQVLPAHVQTTETYTPDNAQCWPAGPISVPSLPDITEDPEAADILSRWNDAGDRAGRNRFAPGGVASEAHAAPIIRNDEAGVAPPKDRKGRFGPTFGETVHKAIGYLVLGQARDADEAVRMAGAQTGLDRNRKQAVEDVVLAHAALLTEGLLGKPGLSLRVEYPVAHASDGRLLVGYIDLLAADGETLHVLDFKTDPPPGGAVEETYPAYVEQVRTYGRILATRPHLATMKLRLGLLFTADGGIREVATRTV